MSHSFTLRSTMTRGIIMGHSLRQLRWTQEAPTITIWRTRMLDKLTWTSNHSLNPIMGNFILHLSNQNIPKIKWRHHKTRPQWILMLEAFFQIMLINKWLNKEFNNKSVRYHLIISWAKINNRLVKIFSQFSKSYIHKNRMLLMTNKIKMNQVNNYIIKLIYKTLY